MKPGARALLWLTLGSTLGALGCEPTFTDRNSEILDRRVLAVRAFPAQAAPGAEVELSALVVEPSGTLQKFPLDWAFCNAPRPIAETNDVSAACLERSGDQFDELGRSPVVSGKMPKDGCRLFGPDVPPNMMGQAPGRPTDPDSTGSYYQPLRVVAANEPEPLITLAQVGLTCNVASLTGAQVFEFQKRVRPNAHPELLGVTIDGDDATPLSLDDGTTEPVKVAPGQRLMLRASWPECPTVSVCGDGICGEDETSTACAEDCTKPMGCPGAEQYVYYDPLARTLTDRRESMRVAWFSGAGTFRDDHTGRREDETETYSDGYWTAPKTPGLVHLWVVLRDSRSGVSWQSYVVDVQ
jgi:hypothetical protein